MHSTAPISSPGAEIESSLLGVLLSAENLREGATLLLESLRPLIDDATVALAVRDRDGITLHVLAEVGGSHRWPERLEPQFALSAQPGVDPGTSSLVVPLRAHGRVVGALLFGDSARASELLRDGELASVLDTTAAVLHALGARTDAALSRSAQSLRSIDAILEGMAHQMANSLTGASAIAQLLAEDLADEGHRAAIGQVRQELTRTFTVLHDLLDFQRDTRAQDGILDLNAIVERTMRFRGYAIREQGIALTVETTSGFMPVRADSQALEHAMLIALRFAELRSTGTVNRGIRVRVTEHGAGEIAIEVTDSGPGNIPELVSAYLDLPFRDDPSARSSSEQPDLGLATSILRGCGGRLEVSASKADGTTLALVLPRANTPNPTSPARQPA
jgi:signal transduction histidine kinase